jgi:DNA-binding IclR family transcriptional regulator
VRVRRPGDRRSLSRSATRALDVLEYFGRVRRPLRAIEIAKALELHPSTTDQLLKTMVDSAHLVFDARTKAYAPSHRLAQFSAWIVDSYGREEDLRELVGEVQAASGEVVTLTTANDLFMQVVDLAGTTPIGESAERGLRVSLFGSTIGAAYLSTLTDAEIGRLAYRARLSAAGKAAVLADVEQIRREGFAEGPAANGEAWSIATPLPLQGLTRMVLGLAGPVDRVSANRPQLQAVMRTAVARWASAVGVP